jgi:hypothetical protein
MGKPGGPPALVINVTSIQGRDTQRFAR